VAAEWVSAVAGVVVSAALILIVFPAIIIGHDVIVFYGVGLCCSG
jgi:hypothetical protein